MIRIASALSRTGGSPLMSKPQQINHSFQGRTMRIRPAPRPPMFEPGLNTQYRIDGRCFTRWVRSALNVMFIEPSMSIRPSMGSSMSAATLERAPSAPMRYFARMVYSCPVRRFSTWTLTPSPSCVWDRYSVENWTCVPRIAAFLTMIGSSRVCGISHGMEGDASS
ncbi:hypothetical protein D9M72_481390 [compost metagenome]